MTDYIASENFLSSNPGPVGGGGGGGVVVVVVAVLFSEWLCIQPLFPIYEALLCSIGRMQPSKRRRTGRGAINFFLYGSILNSKEREDKDTK